MSGLQECEVSPRVSFHHGAEGLPEVLSTGVSSGSVHVPPVASPGVTHTPGFSADQRETKRSTLAWCRKKIGSKAASDEDEVS